MSLTALFFFGVAMRSVAATAEGYVRWIKCTWWGMPGENCRTLSNVGQGHFQLRRQA